MMSPHHLNPCAKGTITPNARNMREKAVSITIRSKRHKSTRIVLAKTLKKRIPIFNGDAARHLWMKPNAVIPMQNGGYFSI